MTEVFEARPKIRIRTLDGWVHGKKVFMDSTTNKLTFISSTGDLTTIETEGTHIEEEVLGPRGGKQWRSMNNTVTSYI